jgi:hypothetical protein
MQDGGTKLKMERWVKIIIAVLVVGVLGFFIYSKIVNWHKGNVETAVIKEKKIWQKKSNQLEQEITNLQEELTVVKGQKVPEEKLAEVFGEEEEEKEKGKKEVSSVKKQPDFADIERQILAFFSYLDNQKYVQSSKLEGGVYNQYKISVEKLSSTLPIVAGEMDSLYNMVRNVAHFYRVLGKNRLLLARQILINESEVIESVMKTYYLWCTMDDEGKATLQGRPSLETQYEYAGYLLNTLGGRSYLLRRGPKERTLTTYYCVLILDRANDAELNSKGIDIRPYLKSSLMEIKNQIGLIYQKEYIAKLNELSLKYP